MPKAIPEDRACLDFAYRSVIGMSVEDEVIVLRDGITVATPNGLERLDASSGALPLLIHQLAQAMQLHVQGALLRKWPEGRSGPFPGQTILRAA